MGRFLTWLRGKFVKPLYRACWYDGTCVHVGDECKFDDEVTCGTSSLGCSYTWTVVNEGKL